MVLLEPDSSLNVAGPYPTVTMLLLPLLLKMSVPDPADGEPPMNVLLLLLAVKL